MLNDFKRIILLININTTNTLGLLFFSTALIDIIVLSLLVNIVLLVSLRGCSVARSLDITHHRHEFVEVNLSVTIVIYLGDSCIELILRIHIPEFFASK